MRLGKELSTLERKKGGGAYMIINEIMLLTN